MKMTFSLKMRLLVLLGSLLIGSIFGMALIPNSRAKAAITPADYPNVQFNTLFNTGTYGADDIAFADGFIYTIDSDSGITECVRKYDQSGNKILGFDTSESSSLSGICVDSGYLYISDQNKHLIYKYDTLGNKIGEVATELGPYDITVKDGYLYVVCQIAQKVQKISTSLSVAATYDVSSDFTGPKSITTDGSYIYVGNFYNDGKIVKYDATFNKTREYIGFDGNPQYMQAQDLFYYDNHIYVSTGYYIISITVDTMEQAYSWIPDIPTSACVTADGNFLATTGSGGSNIKISRIAKSNNNLSSLTVSGGYSLSPVFSSTQLNYSVTVPSTATSLDITPTVEDNTAALYVDWILVTSGVAKSITLTNPTTNVTIAVKAENNTYKNYILTITKEKSSDSTLKSLAFTDYSDFTSSFNSATTNYTLQVPQGTTNVEFVPTANHTGAMLFINNIYSSSGTTQTYNVGPGDNLLKILVIAEDTVTRTNYYVNVRVKSAPDCRYITYLDAGSQFLDGGTTIYDNYLYIGQLSQCAFLFNLSDVTGTVVEASLNMKTQTGDFPGERDFEYDLYNAEDSWVGGISFPAERNNVLLDVKDDRKPPYNISFDVTNIINQTLKTVDKQTSLVFDSPDENYIGVYDNNAPAAWDRPYLFIRLQAIDTLTATYDDSTPQDITFHISVEDTLSSIVNGAHTLIEGTDYTYTLSEKTITIKKEYLTTLATGSYDFIVDLAESTSQTLTVTVVKDSYTIAALDDVTLNEVNKDYVAGSQQTKSITLQKTGTMNLVDIAASISGGINSKFIITQPVNTTLNQTTTSTTFTVKAKDGLAPGTYTETITIKADNMKDVTFLVTQVVNAPPQAASVHFTGVKMLGVTLTGHYTYEDADGDIEGTSVYQWYRSNNASGAGKVAISGATLITYSLQLDDIGYYISFEVTPKASTGSIEGTAVMSSYVGAVVPKYAITLTGDATENDVDHTIDITYSVDPAFTAAITGVSFNGHALVPGQYTVDTTNNNKITLNPGANTGSDIQNSYLRTAGTGDIIISATGYNNSVVRQTITAGVVSSLAITTQPDAGVISGVEFYKHPVVSLKDIYGNLCTNGPSAAATVTAEVTPGTSGSCTITGTTDVSAVAGVATFTGLKCYQVIPGLGAITFSSGSVTVNSNPFKIPPKQSIITVSDRTNNNVDNDIEITFTPNSDFEGKITSITYGDNLLSMTTDYIIESGKITLKPQGGNPALTTATPLKNIIITATGYLDSYISQAIGHGALASLTLTGNITAPASNGGLFAGQPVITLKDQYGNICTGDNSTTVTVSKKDSGTWTLSGTVTATAVNGVVTFLDLGTTNSAHVAGAQLAFNTTGIPEVLSAAVNLPAPASPPPSPVTPSSPSSTPAPVATEQITGEIMQGTSNDTIAQIMIERATYADGSKTDSVTFHESKVAEVIEELKKSGESTARIVIPDKKDEVSQTTVKLPTDTIDTLAKGDIGLQIATEDAKIDIPQKAIQTVNDNSKEDLYFNLVPVTEEKQQKEIIERSIFKAALVSGSSDSSIAVVGVPVTIETNMPSTDVYITLPLSGVTIPTDEAEKEAFLNQLAVYIEHSDGTKELIKGELVTYSDGVMGIKFHITKFSIFTIVRTNALANQTVSASCDVTKVTVPKKTTLDGTKITSTVANKISDVTIKLKVSDKAFWELYSDKACTKLLSNHTMKLKTGTNKAYIKVTAENGTTKIYTITITRQKSSAAAVTKVTAPAKAVIKDTVITATVKSSTDKLTFKVSVSNKATWVLYSDKACKKKIDISRINLKTGLNTFYLKITAEDGKTSKVYTVKITRK